MSQKNTPTSTERRVPLASIFVPEDANYRSHTDKEVDEMVTMLQEDGQQRPLLVTEDGPSEEQPFTLRGGARRMRAFKKMKWKGDVMIVIRKYAANDPLAVAAPHFDTYGDNETQNESSAFERAEWIDRMLRGTYWVPAGQVAVPVPPETLAEKLHTTKAHVNRLRKVFTDLDPEVAQAVQELRKKGQAYIPPTRLLIAMSAVSGEGEDKEAKLASRAKEQAKMLEAWSKKQEELEGAGRKRAERSDTGQPRGKNRGGDDENDGESQGAIKPTKKLDKEKGRTAEDYLKALEKRLARADSVYDEAKVQGVIETVKYFTGKTKKFPLVTEADFKAVAKEEAAEAEEAEEAAE